MAFIVTDLAWDSTWTFLTYGDLIAGLGWILPKHPRIKIEDTREQT